MDKSAYLLRITFENGNISNSQKDIIESRNNIDYYNKQLLKLQIAKQL